MVLSSMKSRSTLSSVLSLDFPDILIIESLAGKPLWGYLNIFYRYYNYCLVNFNICS